MQKITGAGYCVFSPVNEANRHPVAAKDVLDFPFQCNWDVAAITVFMTLSWTREKEPL
jgi:hypothetical protein